MNCRRCRELLFEFAHGSVPQRERLEIEEHLAICADCRREEAATRQSLAAFDALVPREPFDAERGLTDLRKRMAAAPSPALPWWTRLRPLLWPAVAATAATVAAVILLSSPEPAVPTGGRTPVAGIEPGAGAIPAPDAPDAATSPGPGDAAGPDVRGRTALHELIVMVEELPLYEELELFSEHEMLAGLAAADDTMLDELLEEVGG